MPNRFQDALNEARQPHVPIDQSPAGAPDYPVTYFNNPFPGCTTPAEAPADKCHEELQDPDAEGGVDIEPEHAIERGDSEGGEIADEEFREVDGKIERRHNGGDWHSHDDGASAPQTDGEAYIASGDPTPFEAGTDA